MRDLKQHVVMLALDQFLLCFLSQRCWKANLHHEVFFTCLPKKTTGAESVQCTQHKYTVLPDVT